MEVICAACPDCMKERDLMPGDFCRVHWAKVEAEVKAVDFVCEHHS